MKIVGLDYLHKVLQPVIDKIFEEAKDCEIDPARVREVNLRHEEDAFLQLSFAAEQEVGATGYSSKTR